MTEHKVGTREEWLAARTALLADEKDLTRRSDLLARKRQALPWVAVEKDYSFVADDGTKTLAYRRRMGWSFPWVSAAGSDFNLDFAVFTEEGRKTGAGFNFGTPKHAAEIDLRRDELHGLSAFALEDGVVYHTYSAYSRGLDGLWGMYQWLDRAPKGRNETGIWWRRHDEYDR